MATPSQSTHHLELARSLRTRFLEDVSQALREIGPAVGLRLEELVNEPCTNRESQLRRDAWLAYKSAQALWLDRTLQSWRNSLEPTSATSEQSPGGLELVSTEAVENKILASRLVQAVSDKVHAELDDLRVRIKHLEQRDDFKPDDLLRPEVLIVRLVEQWPQAGMTSEAWALVSKEVQRLLIGHLGPAYKAANAMLASQGVLPVIGLKDRVSAPRASASSISRTPRRLPPAGAQTTVAGEARGAQVSATGPLSEPASTGAAGYWRPSGVAAATAHEQALAAADETRMLSAATPLARAKSRAHGVLGQLKRIFVGSTGNTDFARTEYVQPTAALTQAISPQAIAAQYAQGGTLYEDFSPAGVARVATELREKSTELKQKAGSKSEKATIEIVALMFQAILTEERIPPGIRVWFARLQMPVLRVALEDADFFGTADHPARALIDRMGSCVMGFEGTGVQSAAMETEVKRIVQVIEQYPETGKKVYQIVYEEFQKFLSKFLTETEGAQKVVSVAQQVEQKETLAIQYTIEMRDMLKDMPVRDEIRDFLFKIWAEVLAVSALRKGAKHADTQLLKKSATDLVWSASAKPNRADRARVIQDLPNLLARLHAGMTLLAMAPSDQERHVKSISDTLADAFLSKTQAIPQAKIEAMAQRLSNLEDFVSDDVMGDLPLDSETLEMMLGIDATSIEVVSGGGSKPSAAMLAWAGELQLGDWFTLDHNGHVAMVQFAWRSERRHLNLFAASSGKSYLIQAGRLAAYLQAGLLLPQEEEALTVRATRDALAKIEANPERLLA